MIKLHPKHEAMDILFLEDVQGPFVTFVLNTHISHQNISLDTTLVKNFAKAAKKRFEKKFPEIAWQPFQEQIDALLADAAFWREATESVTIILNEKETYVYRLDVPVDDQYYIGSRPYLLGVIKHNQFNYHYYLLALNRDSMKLYEVRNIRAQEVTLPAEAPTDLTKTLGEELTRNESNYSFGATNIYFGVNTKDEEVEIDWINYYTAVDNYLKENFENPEKLPIYLYALPENQAVFKKIAKNPYTDFSKNIALSPIQASEKIIRTHVEKLNQQLKAAEIASYNELLNRKFIDQLIDIVPAAKEGRISHLFISTSNFVNESNEMSSEEFDRRVVLSQTVDAVLQNDGAVFVLEQAASPDEKSLVAILRY